MINDMRELKVLCRMSTVRTEDSILLIGSHRTDSPVASFWAPKTEEGGPIPALEILPIWGRKAIRFCTFFFGSNWFITTILQDALSKV